METNYADLEVNTIDTVIVDTHGDDDTSLMDQWLDFANYTLFQWIVSGAILLLISIIIFCLIYCCLCKPSDSTDPYKDVNLEMHYVSAKSPRSPSNDSEQRKDLEDPFANAIEC